MNHALSPIKVPETMVVSAISNPLRPLDDALACIFSSPAEETKLQRTRRIMGRIIADVSDEDLEVYITELQYLIDAWLDEFERIAYDGLTLKQLLQE